MHIEEQFFDSKNLIYQYSVFQLDIENCSSLMLMYSISIFLKYLSTQDTQGLLKLAQ